MTKSVIHFLLVAFSLGCLPANAAEEKPIDNGAPIPETMQTTTVTNGGPERRAAFARWSDARFGLFLHWGIYSVYGGTYKDKDLWSAEWIQENARIPWKEYAQTAANWNPREFDAEAWVRLAKSAGMRYIVLTAKHHDGFALYPSRASRYNLMSWTKYRGPDPLLALKAACKKHGLLFGIYYSPLEFRISPNGFRPEDEKAVAAGFSYRTLGPEPYASNAEVVKLAKAQIRELAEWYKPDILWFDGTWEKMGTWTDKDARECESAIRAAVPNVLINDRLGVPIVDFKTFENKIPDSAPGVAWEYVWNLGAFWGYNPRNYTVKILGQPQDYVETLVKVSSLGGNYLLNVGPDGDGKFHPMAVDYLTKIGKWVQQYGECVYGVSASPFKEKPAWGYVTCRLKKVYLIVKNWPARGAGIAIPALNNKLLNATLLGDGSRQPIPTACKERQWIITLQGNQPAAPFSVIVLEVEGVPSLRLL